MAMCKEQTIYMTLLWQICAIRLGLISPVLCFLGVGRSLSLFEKRVTRQTVGPNMVGRTGDWRKMHNEELLYTISLSSSSQGILRWAGHVATRSQCLSALRTGRPGYPASLPSGTDIFLLPTASRPVRITQTPIQWRHHRLLFLRKEADHSPQSHSKN
jgi:hypothetical protein